MSEAVGTALMSGVVEQIEEQKVVVDQPKQKYALVTPVKAQSRDDDEPINVKVDPHQEPENPVNNSRDRRQEADEVVMQTVDEVDEESRHAPAARAEDS